MIPDWQLPAGVDRGLWDYLRSEAMVAGYDAAMAATALATQDLRFCEKHFRSGSLADLGCGTGRLCRHFAARGFDCTGYDLSDAMLDEARKAAPEISWVKANLIELTIVNRFDNAACLFSTLGMVRGDAERLQVLRNAFNLLKPGGVFVLHAHNRFFRGLGWKRFFKSEFTMPQHYGGAPLTIRHFSKRELTRLLQQTGFEIMEIAPIGLGDTPATGSGIYGYLAAARKH